MGKKQTINQKQSGMWPDFLKCIRVLYFSDFSLFFQKTFIVHDMEHLRVKADICILSDVQ